VPRQQVECVTWGQGCFFWRISIFQGWNLNKISYRGVNRNSSKLQEGKDILTQYLIDKNGFTNYVYFLRPTFVHIASIQTSSISRLSRSKGSMNQKFVQHKHRFSKAFWKIIILFVNRLTWKVMRFSLYLIIQVHIIPLYLRIQVHITPLHIFSYI